MNIFSESKQLFSFWKNQFFWEKYHDKTNERKIWPRARGPPPHMVCLSVCLSGIKTVKIALVFFFSHTTTSSTAPAPPGAVFWKFQRFINIILWFSEIIGPQPTKLLANVYNQKFSLPANFQIFLLFRINFQFLRCEKTKFCPWTPGVREHKLPSFSTKLRGPKITPFGLRIYSFRKKFMFFFRNIMINCS